MWQRIQTLYLALTIALMIAGSILPVAGFYQSRQNVSYQLDSRGIVELNNQNEPEKIISTNPCTYLFGIIIILITFCIFSYKNRKKQFRLATISILLIALYIIILAVLILYAQNKLDAGARLEYPASFPIIALILNYLALRGIQKDERLVRSTERLR